MSTLLIKEIEQGLHPKIKGATDLKDIIPLSCYVNNKHSYKIKAAGKEYYYFECSNCGLSYSMEKILYWPRVWRQYYEAVNDGRFAKIIHRKKTVIVKYRARNSDDILMETM